MVVTAENGAGGVSKKKAKAEIRHDLPAISDIPAFFPAPGLGRLALSNPIVAGVLLGYTVAEKTQQLWGPPVQAHADQTRQDWDNFMSQFSQFTETGPVSIGGGRGPRATPKPKRKISKANKAFKKAYKIVSKGFKGPMTRKKCEIFMRKASKMASKANPHTKSRIGKAKNATTRHCRKIRKGVWGVTKHA